MDQSTPVLSPTRGSAENNPASNRFRAIQAPTQPASFGWQETPRIFNSQTKPSLLKETTLFLPQEDSQRKPFSGSGRAWLLEPEDNPPLEPRCGDAQVKELDLLQAPRPLRKTCEVARFLTQNNNRNMLSDKKACYGCCQEPCHFRASGGSLC